MDVAAPTALLTSKAIVTFGICPAFKVAGFDNTCLNWKCVSLLSIFPSAVTLAPNESSAPLIWSPKSDYTGTYKVVESAPAAAAWPTALALTDPDAPDLVTHVPSPPVIVIALDIVICI